MKKYIPALFVFVLMILSPVTGHAAKTSVTLTQSIAMAQTVSVVSTTPGGGQAITITAPNGVVYSAYLHLPSDYNTSSKTYPLLIFLHGMGEAGTDLSLIYNNGYAGGPAYLVEHGQLGTYTSPTTGQQSEFIVLAPQATYFSTHGGDLNNLLRGFVPNYRVDTNRIYPTGLSAGGQGVVEFMVHSGWTNQYTAAAAVPMSEAWYYPSQSASVIVGDKVFNWGFGSDPDDKFGVLTHNLMNEINAISPGMSRYTNYSGGHCCWNTFYNPAYRETINGKSMNIYEWMLQYSRGGNNPLMPPSNLYPTANAGPDKAITLPTNSITLTGSGTDTDGTIASYSWTKTAGGAATISSPLSASTTITGLTQGSYTFRLTVTDNAGATAYDDVNVTVNAATVEAPYGGTRWTIPGTIQAEDFDLGGEGLGYHDMDATNSGVKYRTSEGVDITDSMDSSGAYTVGWTAAGEWTNYMVNVGATGSYVPQVRVASPATGTSLRLDMDGATIANVSVPYTGSWNVYQTVTLPSVPLTAGAHVLRVYDTTSGFNINWVSFTATTINAAPTANAGVDQTITLPTSSITLTGSGTDADGSVASYSWTKTAGGAATISSPLSASTTITGLTQGSYTFRLTVTDNAGATAYDDVNVTVNAAPSTSQATTYNIDFGMSTAQTTVVGWNNIINPATSTPLVLVDSTGAVTSKQVQVTDSFYYNPGSSTDSSINSNGTTASGLYPSNATRDSFFLGTLNSLTDNSAALTVSGLDNTATYDFRFYASRGAGDTANRNTNYTISGKTVTLNATNNIAGYADITNIVPSNGTVAISIARDAAAIYGYLGVLQITEHSSSNPAPANKAPTANAGVDQTITLPTSSITLTGSGTDADGSVASYSWTKTAGGAATISSPLSASTTITGLTQGSYTFRLTVTDNAGATAYDDVNVTVNSAPTTPLTSPYGGTRWTIPGTIQAEDFDLGGEGVGYHDVDTTNAAGQYRPSEGVDIEKTADTTGGAYNIGWVYTGEWTSYAVNVATAGNYTIQARTASPYAGKNILIQVDGVTAATIAVPQTFQWQSWGTGSATIALPAGSHTIKAVYDSGININYFTFAQVLGASTDNGCGAGVTHSPVTGYLCQTVTDPAMTVVVTAKNTLNVRSVPMTGSIIGKVSHGATGTIILDSTTWPKVEFQNGLTGYVSRAYISLLTNTQ